jgi:hypothetical protein
MNIIATTRVVALPFLLVALSGLARAQSISSNESEEAAKKEVLKTGEQLGEARKAKDRAALDRILNDRLSWIARGDRLTKSQVIADFLADNLHFTYFAHDNVKVDIFGNTAIVTGHSTSVLEYKGKVFDAPRLFSEVYVKMDGRWQMVNHHVSDLAKTEAKTGASLKP